MRFSIRDILLTTLIVGLALGWYLDRTQLNRKCKANRQSLDAVLVHEHSISQLGVDLRRLSDKYKLSYQITDINDRLTFERVAYKLEPTDIVFKQILQMEIK